MKNLPDDLQQALEEGDPIAKLFVERTYDLSNPADVGVVLAYLDTFPSVSESILDEMLDQNLADSWDYEARNRDYREEG